MKFTDIFIHRPVLATVVSLLILLVGLRSISLLEVRQYPETRDTVVTVTTAYPGASSELVKGFITTPLQQAMQNLRILHTGIRGEVTAGPDAQQAGGEIRVARKGQTGLRGSLRKGIPAMGQ